MAAARAWAAGNLVAASPQPETSDALADARLWGASEDELAGIRQYLQIGPADGVAVWLGNAETVLAFLTADTQWRTTIDVIEGRIRTRWIGLDYGAARVSIQESGLTITPELWTGMRIMEAAARDALNEEAVH